MIATSHITHESLVQLNAQFSNIHSNLPHNLPNSPATHSLLGQLWGVVLYNMLFLSALLRSATPRVTGELQSQGTQCKW